ncbi:hypothetical protein P4G96_21940 [Bacillus cereus]|nr:hypothetical protein [Bacillus cereus]MEB8666738.1 hypothetical protein [Bacillus cereus]
MSKIDSLLRRARKLQADRILTTKVHIVSDSEWIKEIHPEKKARENIYIVGSIGANCVECNNNYRECKCDEGSPGTVTETMYQYWKENDPRHYERLMRLRDQDEQHEETYGLDKWIEDNVLYVRKKKVNGATDKIDQIPLSQMSDEMREVLCKDVKRI